MSSPQPPNLRRVVKLGYRALSEYPAPGPLGGPPGLCAGSSPYWAMYSLKVAKETAVWITECPIRIWTQPLDLSSPLNLSLPSHTTPFPRVSGQTQAFHVNCWPVSSHMPNPSYHLSFEITSLTPSRTAPELAGSQLGCQPFGCLHYCNYHSCIEICVSSRHKYLGQCLTDLCIPEV